MVRTVKLFHNLELSTVISSENTLTTFVTILQDFYKGNKLIINKLCCALK